MGHAKIITRPTPIVRKQMGQMAKLFGLWDNSKLKDPVQRKINPQPIIRDGAPDFLSQIRGIRTKHVTRRQIVLNRHFTEIVSDVLAIDFGKEIEEKGIRITSIETKAWNKGVRIYYTRDGPYDESLQKELIKLEPSIRYAISERRIISRAPQVNFVYDATISFDEAIDRAFAGIDLDDKVGSKQTALSNTGATQLYVTKDLGVQDEKLVSKKFTAPVDMDNTILGLNYPELYDEVATKLIRGRGEASRMTESKTYLTSPKPLFREPQRDNIVEGDPLKRIQLMKSFLISQKMKAEHKARIRRREELLSLNRFKWVKSEDDDIEGTIAPDTPELDHQVD